MQHKQTPVGQPNLYGLARADERQMAVWGQVSARTLQWATMLNLVASLIFYDIAPSRYGPCVAVFFAIGLGSAFYTGWAANRKGMGPLWPRPVSRARLVAQSLLLGVLFYVLARFPAGSSARHDTWPAVVLKIAAETVMWGIGLLFTQALQRRAARRAHEATDDDALDERDPMP